MSTEKMIKKSRKEDGLKRIQRFNRIKILQELFPHDIISACFSKGIYVGKTESGLVFQIRWTDQGLQLFLTKINEELVKIISEKIIKCPPFCSYSVITNVRKKNRQTEHIKSFAYCWAPPEERDQIELIKNLQKKRDFQVL